MAGKHSKSTVITSLLWKFMERSGTTGIQFIVQIILARLLLPENFGLIAIVLVFISFANVFVQSGFNMALVQKRNADAKDFSSVFFLSLFVAGLLYVAILSASPFIAEFYRNPELIPILRVLSITLFIGAFNSIQNAYVARNMLFKKQFFSNLGSIIISGTIGITAAYLGFGVWSLVIQRLTSQLTICIILWFTVKWRPHWLFSFERVRTLFSFGWKLLVSNIIYVLYQDIRTLIIGKMFTPSMLGFYNRGESFPSIIVRDIDGSIQSVMFPAFSAYQDDKQKLKSMIRRSIITSSFLVFPAMMGLAVVAEPLVRIMLTDKWLPAVPFLQIFCITNAISPIQVVNLQVINAIGRSDITLKIGVVKRVFELAVLLISIPLGIYAIALGTAVGAFGSMLINIYPNKRFLDYSYLEIAKDIAPSLFLSFVMGAIVYMFNFVDLEAYQILVLQIFAGIIIYIGLAKLFRLESLDYIMVSIRETFKG